LGRSLGRRCDPDAAACHGVLEEEEGLTMRSRSSHRGTVPNGVRAQAAATR
jgi:hypothetical protein